MRISDWSSDVCSSDLKIAELIADGFQLSRYNPHQLGQRKVTNLHQELARPQIWDIRCGEPCCKPRSSTPRLYLACLTPSILSSPLTLRSIKRSIHPTLHKPITNSPTTHQPTTKN